MALGFELLHPTSVAQAVAMLSAPGARLLAGGTDLVPNMLRGIERPAQLVELSAVEGLAEIAYEEHLLEVGAGVTLAQLGADARVARDFPAIAQGLREVAALAHRNAATVGGNLCLDTRCVFYNQSEWWRAANDHCLKRGGDTCHVAPQGTRCHAAYCGDLAPIFIALEAKVAIASVDGMRTIPLEALYRDDGAAHLTLASGELVTSVSVTRDDAMRSGYRKARVRRAIDFPLAGVAIALAMDDGRIARLRVALTGTNAYPLLLDGTSDLVGRSVDADCEAALGRLVAKQVSPMRTTATASNYRRQIASVLARRLLRELAAQEI